MRPPTACEVCRLRRRKCNIASLGSACTYCLRGNRLCSAQVRSPASAWSGDLRRPASAVSGHEPSTKSALSQLSTSQRLDLVRLYFDFVHDKFHSLFHQPTTMEDITQGRLPDVLLGGMIALSARFHPDLDDVHEDPKLRGEVFARESARLLDLRHISRTTVQACILLGAFSITEGEADAEAVYYSAACRMALLLDLPNRAVSNELDREVNIRIWWSLRMIDVWSSTGVNLPLLLPISSSVETDAPMPIDELIFQNLQPEDSCGPFTVVHGPPSSLLTQMIKLNRILIEVNNVNERAVSGALDRGFVIDLVLEVSQKLDTWQKELPEYMHDTPTNLERYASQGLGGLFVAVYLGYYHYGQLLYYQFLHEDCVNPMPNAHLYARKCKTYAANLCSILYAANNTAGCEMLHTMLGHVLVISSTVQIHTLLFDEDEQQIALSKTRLERNYEILVKLRKYWRTLDIVFTRLRAFHKACQVWSEGSFRMDQWMLRFLSEFARPVDDRELDEPPLLEILER